MIKKKAVRYNKPQIKSKKIKLNFFLSRKFLSSEEEILLAGPKSMCFIDNTHIIMADRQIREIQNIKTGDLILSFDYTSHTFVKNRVSQLIVHPKIRSDYLIINSKLKVTLDHPIWVVDLGWKKAASLHLGDSLLNSKGASIIVKSINYEIGNRNFYNLCFEGESHTYFADDVLVHNAVFKLSKENRADYKQFLSLATNLHS